jgi:COP9 signalosome complex subunit 1
MEPAGTSTAAGVAARKPGGSSAPATTAAAASTSSSSMGESAREKVQAKLDLASALAYLGQGSYEKAARAFLKIKSIRALDDWAGKVGLNVGGYRFLT